MTVKNPTRLPKYSLHKPSGRARVILDGKHIFLGKHGSDSSKEKYKELVARWLAGSLKRPKPQEPITMVELMALYLKFAGDYYVKNGQPTRELGCTKEALCFVRKLFELLPVDEFGPRSLARVRDDMIAYGWARKHINKQVGRIVRMFKWAVSEELAKAETYEALKTLSGLQQGRTKARETDPVERVSDEVVDATLPELSPIVADMVRFQRITGCRPTEVCLLRPGAIDRTADVWLFTPDTHKTEHTGRDRVVFIGPRAQSILIKYLLRGDGDFCFDPREAPGARKNSKNRYTKDSYGRAVRRAVQRTNKRRMEMCEDPGAVQLLELWSPNRLRHARATEVRKEFGLEAAQVTCGHASADVTQIYAERDTQLGISVARRSG